MDSQSYQEATIRRYEKRIKKTQRVANQTEQKLKKQRSSLLHFKKELSRHVVTLQELSKSGDPHAQKRLKNVRMKLAQLDKIVPYLGKYISVNRQAEMQTIAVLKESCTMELQKLSQRSSASTTKPATVTGSFAVVPETDDAPSSKSPLHSGDLQPDYHTPSADENPYASLSEIKKDIPLNPVKLRSNYAELDFQRVRGSDNIRPPSVKYCEVRIDALGIGRVTPDTGLAVTISSAQERASDFDNDEITESNLLNDTTLTPENAKLLEKLSDSNANSEHPDDTNSTDQSGEEQLNVCQLPESAGISQAENVVVFQDQLFSSSVPMESVKNKSPPPVAIKPSMRHSPIHRPINQNIESSQYESDVKNPDVVSEELVSSSTCNATHSTSSGMLSVADRIKVCMSTC